MRQRILVLACAVCVAIGLAAASPKAAAKGKKKAAPHTMTGCLQKGEEPNTFKLTNVEGTGPKTVELVGASAGTNLSAHVGHKVAITGVTVGAKAAAKAEGEAKKKEHGEYHMRVESLKMIAASCS